MNRIPSLDLMNGKVVRLKKGDFEQVTVYSEDPCACILSLMQAGATCIHIVDLDQTRKGIGEPNGLNTISTINSEVIKKVIATYRGCLTLQLGGGIRTYESARTWFELGIDRIVVGTLFFSDYKNYTRLVNDYKDQVILALDVDQDEVRHSGWQVGSGVAIDAILKSGKIGDVHSILVTDIGTDGMLTGPNLELLERIKSYPIIASGGIASEADCASIQALGITYAIVGKAYYEGHVTRLGNDNNPITGGNL